MPSWTGVGCKSMGLFIGVYLAFNFVLMLAYERLMGVFFEERRTSLPLWLGAYLLYYVLSSIAFLQVNFPFLSLGISMLTLFVITLTYEGSMIKRLMAVGSILVLVIALETIVSVATQGPLDWHTAGNAFDFQIYVFILIGFLCYFVAVLFRKFKNIKKNTISSPGLLIAIAVIPIASMIAFYFIATHLSQIPALIITAAIFATNILFLMFQDHLSAAYEDKLRAALHQQERDYYFSQLQLMQQSAEQIKAIRHDMKLHLATATDFIKKDNAKDARDYLEGLLGDINEGQVYSDTGNIAVDSIINFKLKSAGERSIQTEVDVLVPQTLALEVAGVVTILGNLLDNALEGVAKAEDKWIKVRVTSSKGNLLIKVENTFDGVVKTVEKNPQGKGFPIQINGKERYLVSRKEDDNHGYGLGNIQKAVDKVQGHLEVAFEGNVFRVGALLYVDGR